MMAISLGEMFPLPPLAMDRGDLWLLLSVSMMDFFGANESRLDDLEDLLLAVLMLDLVDLRAEGMACDGVDEEEDGLAHCIMVLRRNLLFSCSVPRPDGLPCRSISFFFCETEVFDLVATVNAGRLPLDPYEAEDPAVVDFVSLVLSSAAVAAADGTAMALAIGLEACRDDEETTDREALLILVLLATLTALLLLMLRTLTALTALLLLL